jgi:hypothetical protein
VTATGAPAPPAPSSSAPKAKAISSNWSRESSVIPAIDRFMVSNWPVSTAMS